MNTYRAIQTEAGHWAVEWYVDEERQGLVWGRHATEVDALVAVLNLARMERREAQPPILPANDTPSPLPPAPRPPDA